MPDSFNGAEASVDAQRKSALDALAQFGRRGLESAVLAQQEGNRVQSAAGQANTQFGDQLNVGAAGQAELAAFGAPAKAAVATDRAQASGFVASENDAAQSVNGNFYNQVRQSVPLARTEADQMVDEYRAAYAERQAQARAQAEMQQQEVLAAALRAKEERAAALRAQALFELERQGLLPPAYARSIGPSINQLDHAVARRSSPVSINQTERRGR